MKLKELKDVIAIVTYTVIEGTNNQELLHGYYEWFKDINLEDKEIVTIYVKDRNLHIMIK